jgi:flagellin-like protein
MLMKGGIIMEKKGISAVVATVLIILITVAAVTIIWAAIIPMINNQLSKGTICLDAISQLSIENKGYTCIDGSDLKVQIGHGATNFDLADIQVLISSNGSTESINLVADGVITLAELPGTNEERTFTISTMTTPVAEIETVNIAPIVTVGDTTEACEALAPIKIKAC